MIPVDSLEVVQREYLLFVNFKLGIPLEDKEYNYLHNMMNLESLKRRTQSDAHTLFKLINGLIEGLELLELIQLEVPRRITRQDELFAMNFHYRTNYGLNSPMVRLCTAANTYCTHLFNLSCPIFKAIFFFVYILMGD